MRLVSQNFEITLPKPTKLAFSKCATYDVPDHFEGVFGQPGAAGILRRSVTVSAAFHGGGANSKGGKLNRYRRAATDLPQRTDSDGPGARNGCPVLVR